MSDLEEMLGQSSAIEGVRETMRRLLGLQQAGRRPPAILLQGETGTGKGLVARTIHRMGPRSRGRFVDVNCAAIPDTLIEAELFGYERGAFTDARRAKPGLFQTAHQGTIFLDEVALLPEALQAKLLTVIEERAVRRLGGTQSEPADTWIISATNADLPAAIRARRFREDLYHRLSVLVLHLPALRERDGDILLLAEKFLSRVCADYSLPSKSLDSSARKRLMAHAWPGNIRELSNAIERAALLTEGSVITGEGLALGDSTAVERPESSGEQASSSRAEVASLDETLREHLQSALDRTGWNISRTAALLGITRNTLRARIARLGLRGRPPSAPPARREARVAPATPGASVGAGPGQAPDARPTGKIAAMRWERRRISLMRIALGMPETGEALSVAGRALETLIEKVRSFGGRVESLGQSGLEASFGVEPVEDAPRRAVHAAMAIQRAVERERDTTSEPLTLRIGILATQAMVAQAGGLTHIDEDARQQGGPVLDGLLAAADPGSVLLDRAAATLLERRFEFMTVTLPGSEGRDIAYRLAGREGTGLSPGGRMAAFVGRDQEMAVLKSRLEAALRGQGQLVSIVGDAGIGKSRLLFEFRQSLTGQDVAYVEGRCLSYGNTIPYLPLLDLIRAACGIGDVDTVEASTEKIRHALGASGADAEARTPYLLHLLGYKDGTDALETVPPDTIKAHVSDSLRHLTVGTSQTRPLLLVVEDLHWSDRASEEMLASLVNALHGARVLFIATHRPGYVPPWAGKSFATRLTLPPLSDEDSLRVAQSVVPTGSLSGPVASAILSKAEGNPFFLEELVLAVQGSARPTAESGIPDTVQGVLTSRIGRLPDTERAVLQSAAVVGKDVPLPILAAISDLTDEILRSALRHLGAAEFLYEVGDGPEVKHRFRHALTHEVAYESLEPERRLLLHARILSTIERLYADRLPEHVDRLAHHAVRGQAWDKALVYLRQAGTQAFLRSANREAVAYLEQALEALAHLPSTPDSQSQAVDLRFDLRTALLPLGEIQRGLTFLQEAEAIARESQDEHRRGQIAVHLTGQLYLLGDHARALVYGQQALTINHGLGDFSLGVSAHAYLGQVYHVRGDYHEAAIAFRKNVESLAGDRRLERFGLPQPPSIHSRTCLVWSLAELGQFAEGITRGEEAIEIAKTVAQPLGLTVAYSGLGQLYARMGELERAIPLLEQALELSQTWNIPLWFPRIASALGAAYSLAGRGEESIRLLGRAVEEGERMGLVGGHALVLTWLAEAYESIGDTTAARGHAERAYDMAQRYRERGHEAWALRLLGELAGHAYPVDPGRAREHLERARALGEELMMRPLIARCRLSLARVFAGAGERDRAAVELDAAGREFGQLGMTYWSRQVEAERATG
jgi:DNA-binding NtrC family response regulator/tetratricopeptide (TPR) repeat protein